MEATVEQRSQIDGLNCFDLNSVHPGMCEKLMSWPEGSLFV